ncbi:MAG: hypothetical protein ABI461_06560 [Polyangiaceae bacterium]
MRDHFFLSWGGVEALKHRAHEEAPAAVAADAFAPAAAESFSAPITATTVVVAAPITAAATAVMAPRTVPAVAKPASVSATMTAAVKAAPMASDFDESIKQSVPKRKPNMIHFSW